MSERTSAERIVKTGATLTRVTDGDLALATDLRAADPLVILIHGFTAHGDDVRNLGLNLHRWGREEGVLPNINVMLFSYDSFSGIPQAADVLLERLRAYCVRPGESLEIVLARRLVLVGHSMGGLVARQFAIRAPAIIRGLVMLGTPNEGVATDVIVDYLIALAEYLDEPIPQLRTKSSVSRRQLTRKDSDRSRPFIDELNDQWVHAPQRPATLTVAGGKRMIELGRSSFYNTYVNMKLQRLFDGAANDGLVPEKSVDMSRAVFKQPLTGYSHYNQYAEYAFINHSNLAQNTGLMRHVYNWLEQRCVST